MRNSRAYQWLLRIFIYILGLFFLALGVAISVNANLGISPVNSLPYVVSQISGVQLSVCVIAVFSIYILLQIVLLRRQFQWINLTQLIFSTIFGYFVDFCKFLLGDFALPTYLGSLVMLLASILVVALGVTLYIEVDLVPMPMEGLTLAISQKLKQPFHNVKIVVDCAVVGLGLILCLAVLHRLDGIREGTVIAAIVTGKAVALLKKPLVPVIQRLCFAGEASAATPEEG